MLKKFSLFIILSFLFSFIYLMEYSISTEIVRELERKMEEYKKIVNEVKYLRSYWHKLSIKYYVGREVNR